MKSIIKFPVFIFLLVIILFSCQKKYLCPNCNTNQPPIANAGVDQKIVLPKDSVLLDGSSSSDLDGKVVSYKWIKISGPDSSTIINTDSSKTLVKTLVMGVYKFELTVTDDGGLSAKDTVQVIVDDPAINQPPVANAGTDQTITLPVNTVNLDGSGSTDPDNNITNYAWIKISGPASFNISNANAVQTQVTNLLQGIYLFELKVTDAGGLFSKDTMRVTVNTAINNNCNLSQTFIGSLSIQRSSVNILEAGNKIVFAGGFAGSSGPPMYGASSRVDIYDRANQTWSTAELSLTRFHMGTIALGNKVYFAGGDNGHPCSRIDIYDASSNNWSTAELSEPREAVIAVAAGNKVLFAGGITRGSGRSNKVDIYDQSTGAWSTATLSHPTAGSYPGKYIFEASGVIVVGNKIYFMLADNTVDVFDVQLNSWSTLIDNANQLADNRVVSIGNSIYFSGATLINMSLANTLETYNISNNSWTSVNMSKPRWDMAAFAGDDKIFWAGGMDSIWYENNEQYVRCMDNIEIYDIGTGSHSFHNLQVQSCFIKTLRTDNKIIFAYYNYIEIYDIATHSWETCNIYLTQSLAIGNTIYRIGDNSGVWKLDF